MRLLRTYALRVLGVAAVAAAVAAWTYGAARAAELAAPRGMVILTVGGAVQNWNRGPLVEKRDGLLSFHEVEFGRALAFDREMLDRLEQGRVVAHPPQIDEPGTFAGPTLQAVLQAAGADGDVVLVLALDGYVVELTRADRADTDWILAATLDGLPLPLGGTGPLWLVHTPEDGPVPTPDEEARWAWATFYIGAD